LWSFGPWRKFCGGEYFLEAESEVKLTVCIAVPLEMARIGHLVEIMIGNVLRWRLSGTVAAENGNQLSAVEYLVH
jgi:hypothetical protein